MTLVNVQRNEFIKGATTMSIEGLDRLIQDIENHNRKEGKDNDEGQ